MKLIRIWTFLVFLTFVLSCQLTHGQVAPSLGTGLISGNNFQFQISGSAGDAVTVKASVDLVNWTALGTVALDGSGSYTFADTGAASLSCRFYSVSDGSVYSANIYGFMRVSVPAGGFNLIADQLNNPAGNTLGVLLPNVPDGTYVDQLTGSGQSVTVSTFFSSANAWDHPEVTLNPGQGVGIHNPSSTALNLVFIGNVPTGPQTLSIPAGYSWLSSMLPRSAGLDVLGFPATENDFAEFYNSGTQNYDQPSYYACDPCAWYNEDYTALQVPVPAVGQPFLFQSASSSTRTWTQNLSTSR